MTLRFGILVFPNVQQLDLTGPYEVFATARGAEVVLVWKDRQAGAASIRSSKTRWSSTSCASGQPRPAM